MRRVAVAALVVACAVVATLPADRGGADSGATPGAPAAAIPGVHTTLQRSTLFETHRALLLEVRNSGDHDIRVGGIQLDSALFEAVPPEDRDAVVRPTGRPVAMPLPFGTAVCDDVAEKPPQLVTDIDGEPVRVPVDEVPAGVLAGLHDAECAAAAVRADVELRLGDHWQRIPPRTVEGELEVVQRRPGVTAAVDELLGNVIFTVGGGSGPGAWAEVSDDRPSSGVDVAITAARCDPHALIEYKRTFILTALVTVGGEEPVRVDIAAEGEARRALEDLLAACIG